MSCGLAQIDSKLRIPHTRFRIPLNATADNPIAVAASHCESVASFLTFAAEALGIDHSQEGDIITLSFDHREHPSWPKPYQIRTWVGGDAAQSPRKVISAIEGLAWLWKLVSLDKGALVARPASQPEAVHEFSQRLFDAYQVEKGQTQLAGCRLSEVPFLRITERDEDRPSEVVHHFFSADGAEVDESTIAELDLANLEPLGGHPTKLVPARLKSLVSQVDTAEARFAAVTVVAAKRAEGAVQFAIGEQCARVAFDDWTQTLTPPPFHCAASNIDTYHLAAIDDGRIVAAEAIAFCEESGARVLECELATCTSSGKRVDPRLASTCAVSGNIELEEELVVCAACGQRVSRQVLRKEICTACRELPAVRTSDALVATLLERYPLLAKYGKLRAEVRGDLLRLMAVGWWRRVLLTMPVGSAEPHRVAVREGLAGPWRELPQGEWPQVLGGD